MINPSSIDLEQFFTTWHGTPTRPPKPINTEHAWLPSPLKQWLDLSWRRSVKTLNHMRDPDEWTVSQGKVEFMEDPSGDWFWAFDAADPAVVYDRALHEDWQQVPETLPEFLAHLALIEAPYNAAPTLQAAAVPSQLVAHIVAPMEEIAFGTWRWPDVGFRIFMNQTLIALIGPAHSPNANPDTHSVRVSSPRREGLRYLEALPHTEWR